MTNTTTEAEHGTRSRYVTGCRCFDCRSANNAYFRERRRRPQVNRPGVFDSRPALPEPEVDDLANYADPDCSDCHGTGGTLAEPCEPCIVGVWA